MADNCIKCGRPLTNPKSRRARVGTTCIKRYGPQPRKIPNPAHAVWQEKRQRAESERAAEQRAFDAEFASAQSTYEADLAAFKAAKLDRKAGRRI